MRRSLVGTVAPNPGHYALATLETRVPRLLLATQNVDGLHQRAGSRAVVELHGNITRVKCSRCDAPAATWDETQAPPRCARCDAFLRPDVVWFEEMLPAAALAAAEDAAATCDLLLVAGTSAEVYPAAALPALARRTGARVVEVNPDVTPLSATASDTLRGPAGVVLPALVQAAFPD
jgi:NAD-dependent deacetylase